MNVVNVVTLSIALLAGGLALSVAIATTRTRRAERRRQLERLR